MRSLDLGKLFVISFSGNGFPLGESGPRVLDFKTFERQLALLVLDNLIRSMHLGNSGLCGRCFIFSAHEDPSSTSFAQAQEKTDNSFRAQFHQEGPTNSSKRSEEEAEKPQEALPLEGDYQILGVSKDSSLEDIKKAYKKKMLEWHPDKRRHQREECLEMTTKLNAAYERIVSSLEQKNL